MQGFSSIPVDNLGRGVSVHLVEMGEEGDWETQVRFRQRTEDRFVLKPVRKDHRCNFVVGRKVLDYGTGGSSSV